MAQVSELTFLEFAGLPRLLNNADRFVQRANSGDWRNTSAGVFVWHPGQPDEETFDLSSSFPTADGRDRADRLEAYMYRVYKLRGGKGEFEPYPAHVEDPED